MQAYRIRNWSTHFETSESKKRKWLAWVAVPTSMDGKRYRRLARHEDATEIFGAFVLMLEVAANCPVRGTLIDDHGEPLTPEGLADKTGHPAAIFEKALAVLSSPEIGWLEPVPESAATPAKSGKFRQRPADGPNLPESAATPADRAATPAKTSPTVHDNTVHDITKHHITKHDITKRAGARYSSRNSSELRISISSDSDSTRDSSGRARLRVQFDKASIPLFASEGKQRRSDSTIARRWFDEHIAPRGVPAEEAESRLAKFVKLAESAQRNARGRPMAYLSKRGVVERAVKA